MRYAALRFVLVVAIAAGPCRALHAQTAVPASVGERLRLTTLDESARRHRDAGRVVAVQVDSLSLADDAGRVTVVSLQRLVKVEVSRGLRTSGRRWMVYGFVLGAGAGALAGAITYKEGTPPECLPDDFLFCTGPSKPYRGFSAGTGAVLGGIAGMTVGGISGRFHHSEHWATRPLGALSRVGVRRSPNGNLLHVSMRF